MKNYQLSFLTLLMAMLFSFASCSKDEGSGQSGSPTSTLQVTVVFEPGQLGDLGYADRVLRGLQKVESENEGTIDTRYLYLSDDEKSKTALARWAENRTNPFTADKNYQRRLLVLTEAEQLEWLNGITLDENDEVLMLNTDKDAIASSALGNRIHVLNISAAEGAEKYFNIIDQLEKTDLIDTYPTVGMLRWSEKTNYADSIAETFQKHYGQTKSLDTQYFEEMLLDSSSYITVGYRFAGIFYDSDAMEFSFSIIDAGIANLGFDYYLFNVDQGIARFLYLDSDKTSLERFTIVRKFDEALVQWVNRWKTAAVGTLPKDEWHGAWDGYTDDDISLY